MGQDTIGPYRVQSLVKQGGEGSVYAGYDRRLKRQVALKLIAAPRDREQREQVVAEARALARLNHRSIVQIFDVVETKSHLVLVMEYVPGLDLQVLCEQVALQQATVIQLGINLCSALAAAQRAGVVHRDLKPANVLIASSGQVKLGDFGIALGVPQAAPKAASNEDTLPVSVPGTLLAMSPEHAAGAELDARTDVFALGLILYRCLAGEHPFATAANDLVLLQQVQHTPHTPLQERNTAIAPELSELVDLMLTKDPRQRTLGALEVRQALIKIKRTVPVYQGAALSAVMGGRSREIMQIDSPSRLPASVTGAARSRLLSRAEWGRWGRPHPSRYIAGAMAASVLAGSGLLYYQEVAKTVQPVELRPPLIAAMSEGESLPSTDELHRLLGQALAATGQFSAAGATPEERLHTRIRCNTYLCELRMIRETHGQQREDYSVLLTGVPPRAWRSSMDRAIGRLYGN
ncbi:serine/threonine protein kinase [Halieaceae bacterium IMCC14734]|uniref:Serine/threonine protein kinase n=1 Tax=Candidatus Litorirhabdus singularis TaxID=2518993 RepID=A0ABT3TJH7_9GAMM|nr:serine/threonine-protein kinase [Candidatus Litorirhabdus singularis]MCX2982365.1 serine/threonine protein kinase [Candidatus Litorirhabdus singularis]